MKGVFMVALRGVTLVVLHDGPSRGSLSRSFSRALGSFMGSLERGPYGATLTRIHDVHSPTSLVLIFSLA